MTIKHTREPWYLLVDKNKQNWFEVLIRFKPDVPDEELVGNVSLIRNAPAMYELIDRLANGDGAHNELVIDAQKLLEEFK